MNEDPSEAVNRVAAKLAEHEQPLPADVEAAWAEWIAGMQKVDERTKLLLRASYEAGAEAAKRSMGR